VRTVFADTLYWVASLTLGDPWHAATLRAVASLGQFHVVTTEEVLDEFLTAYAGRGEFLRRQAAKAVRAAMGNPHVTVRSQSHQSFLAGLALYESRADKAYSLTDCISMVTMRDEGITEVLTNDHHFTQEGFLILIHR
jgi:predicted nucleic acid-binding protein